MSVSQTTSSSYTSASDAEGLTNIAESSTNSEKLKESGEKDGMKTKETKKNILSGPSFLKILINNLYVGSIIGKNGAVITSIEKDTNCTIKLSSPNSYFYNSLDRILVMSGETEEIQQAAKIIINKLLDLYVHKTLDNNNSNKFVFKIVVPKSAVSVLIGKGGKDIKELQASSGAHIHISSREEGMDERIICISGGGENVINASLLVIESIQSCPNLKDHMYINYNCSNNNLCADAGNVGNNMYSYMAQGNSMQYDLFGGGGGGVSYIPHLYGGVVPSYAYNFPAMSTSSGMVNYPLLNASSGSGSLYANLGQANICTNNNFILNRDCEIIMELPDGCIGYIIGRNGNYLADVIMQTHAKIQIAPKGELVPHTNNRKVVISGTVLSVHQAHIMLLKRLFVAQNINNTDSNNYHTKNSLNSVLAVDNELFNQHLQQNANLSLNNNYVLSASIPQNMYGY